VVVNGSASDVTVTLPDAGRKNPSLFELRLTTSPRHKQRQGIQVAAGDIDLAEANSISIYRT